MIIRFQRPIVLEKRAEIPAKHRDAFLAVIRVLEGLLVNNNFFANNQISLADISMLPSVLMAVVSALFIDLLSE